MATGLSLNTRIPNPFRASAGETASGLRHRHHHEPSSPHLLCTRVGEGQAREDEPPSPVTAVEGAQEPAAAEAPRQQAETPEPEVDDRGAFLYRLLTFNQGVDSAGPMHPLGWREKVSW